MGSEANACLILQDEGVIPAHVVLDTKVYHPQLISHQDSVHQRPSLVVDLPLALPWKKIFC